MIKNDWVTFVAIGGVLLLLVPNKIFTQKIGFEEGIDCIIKGGDRGVFSTPKICLDYYSGYSRDLRKRIARSPDTKAGKTQKRIWIRHLNDLENLRENGLSKTFFKGVQ
ncbi:MAG: hypothetical protein QNK79_07175 [Synechococcus sp. ArSW.bin.68]